MSGFISDMRRSGNGLLLRVCVMGALGCAFSINVPMLIGFRFLLGISVGTASFVAPLYISAVSPPKVRGGLVSFNQLAVTSGILIAYIVNFLLKDGTGNWRWMLGLAALPGAALAIGMLSVPHTPAGSYRSSGTMRRAACWNGCATPTPTLTSTASCAP